MNRNIFKISINIERVEGGFIPGQTSEIEQNLYITTEKETSRCQWKLSYSEFGEWLCLLSGWG